MLRFFAKWLWLLWCWLEVSVFTAVLYAMSWLPRPLTGRYYHELSRVWCRFFVRALGIDLRLHQKNILPVPEQYILISNHPSALEDFAIPALFDIYPLAKKGVRHWYFIGRISDRSESIFVKRDDPDSRRAALEALTDAVNKGRNVAIFPEGGCKGRRIHSSFQTGAFEQDRFEWHDPHTLLHKFWHFMTAQNNRANYYVYDAISPQGFSDKHAFAEHVHQQYLQWQKRYLD
jgi:1-acyl-sn-glycerol-3-phosphate acyltransferase